MGIIYLLLVVLSVAVISVVKSDKFLDGEWEGEDEL
jgi:hypothetical protein